MQISQKGIDLIKSFEGLRLTAYNATGKEEFLTIGYGHYGADVKPGQTITKQQAEDLLRKDLQRYVDGVNSAIKVDVNQNQFDAMVSLCYNIGCGGKNTSKGFYNSSVAKYVNAKNFKKASESFALYNKGGGVVLKGLVTRRAKERALFDTPVAVTVEKPVTTPSTNIGTVEIICDSLYLRTGAGTQFPVVQVDGKDRVLKKGEKYRTYGAKDGFYILGGGCCSANPKYVKFTPTK